MLQFVVTYIVGPILLGMFIYVLDKKVGVPIKAFFWALGKPKGTPLPKENEKCFIYGRLARPRVVIMGLLAASKAFCAVFFWGDGILAEVVEAISNTFWLVVGTYLGPYMDWAFGSADAFLEKVEGVETKIHSGQTTLGREVRGVADAAADRVRDSYHTVRDRATSVRHPSAGAPATPAAPTTTVTVEPQAPPPAAPAETETEEDPDEVLRRYLNRGGR